MQATKENAQKACEALDELYQSVELFKPHETDETRSEKLRDFLFDFIRAAQRKLPSEEAYQKEAARRKRKTPNDK